MPTRLFVILLLASGLHACGQEKLQHNAYMTGDRAAARDQLARLDGQRQRTIEENEADRTHNEGMLR
jgi:hypothetical protein